MFWKLLDILLLTSLLVVAHVAVAESATSGARIGVIEEGYGPGKLNGISEDFQLRVRQLFYWDGEHWKSYQELLEAENHRAESEESKEFAARRRWYLPESETNASIVSEGEPLSRGKYHLYFSVQEIVEGLDSIPLRESSDKYETMHDYRVQPPVVVCTNVDYSANCSLPESTTLRSPSIPKRVVVAGENKIRYHRPTDDLPSEVATEIEAEWRYLLEEAIVFPIDKEKVSLFEFKRTGESGWIPLMTPPFVVEDQSTQEAWCLGVGLKFICAGDFNSDGVWEYLFWIGKSNENGYLLATERFRQTASYSW